MNRDKRYIDLWDAIKMTIDSHPDYKSNWEFIAIGTLFYNYRNNMSASNTEKFWKCFVKKNGIRDNMRDIFKDNPYEIVDCICSYFYSLFLYRDSILDNCNFIDSNSFYLSNKYINWSKNVRNIFKDMENNKLFSFDSSNSIKKAILNDFTIGQLYEIGNIFYRCMECGINDDLLNKYKGIDDGKINNLKINSRMLKDFKGVLLSGVNFTGKRVSYMDDTTAIISDIGNVRTNQEDAALCIYHSKNSEFKLLAVSDGVGGSNAGEEASNYILTRIQQWFLTLPFQYYNSINGVMLYNSLIECIWDINNNVNKCNDGRGATLVITIILDDKVFYLNIGDSRIYNYYHGLLQQISEDESYVMKLYSSLQIDFYDDIRFNKFNNTIANYIGKNNLSINDYGFISKDKIGDMYLCTDGVSDLLSNNEFNEIINDNREDLYLIVKNIIDYIMTHNSIAREGLDLNINNSILKAGKDNATCIGVRVRNK